MAASLDLLVQVVCSRKQFCSVCVLSRAALTGQVLLPKPQRQIVTPLLWNLSEARTDWHSRPCATRLCSHVAHSLTVPKFRLCYGTVGSTRCCSVGVSNVKTYQKQLLDGTV